MNHIILLCFLLVSLTARGQQPAYKDFDVQQPAEPHGGFKLLNQFMAINVSKPFMAQVANKKGLVVLQGVVEPDGRITEATVIRSLRPDCDREAIRAFSLFNAWKPAQKDGKAVRQVVTYPVQFGANDPVRYENGVVIRYHDNSFRLVASPDSAALRSEMPADTLGIPTGDLVFFRRKGDKWKKEAEMKLIRESKPGQKATEGELFTLGHYDVNSKAFGKLYTVDNQNRIYEEREYDLDRKPTVVLIRNNNRLVTRLEIHGETQVKTTSWYGNGQLKEMTVQPSDQVFGKNLISKQMLAYWDSTGNQLVNGGNGRFTQTERVRSVSDTSRYTTLTEQGTYANGLKQGLWTGKQADNSYWYEEQYDNGTLQLGKTIDASRSDTLRYSVAEQQPEFKGGMSELGRHLTNNLRFPEEARKGGIQGRVFVSFVVCEDGSLCDFNVLKGVHPALDAEALRVTRLMSGRWKPGIQRGRPVRVKYNLPINFAFN